MHDVSSMQVRRSIWLLTQSIATRFTVRLGAVRATGSYACVYVNVFYDGVPMEELNSAGGHHISLFQGPASHPLIC